MVSSPLVSAWLQFDETASDTFDFLPDIEGEYIVRLTATDARGGSSSVDATVIAVVPFAMLDYRPIDAEYSRALDRIVLVSEASNRVHVLDPATMEESEIGLNLLPTAVSVSPDGLFAAVGHDGWVSHVDLVNGTVLEVIPVGADAGDVVFAGNGYIYVFPRVDQWVTIHSLDTASGLKTKSRDTIYAATLPKLHPDGVSIYGTNNGISPSDLEKYSLDDGTAEVLYDSPYHGDYEICGDLWLSEDGNRVFTKCGNVFRSTSSRDTDMLYNGSFDGVEGIVHLSHSAAADEIALVPIGDWWDESDEELQYVKRFSYEFLEYQGQVKLPSVVAGSSAIQPWASTSFTPPTGPRMPSSRPWESQHF